jgi:hypothetical protein
MKRSAYILFSLIILVFWSSCRKDFEFTPSTGSLEFSRDTVYLDTVFTDIGSSTYNLKVYNKSNEDILIPSIQLAEGYNSFYRMTIDGLTGISNGTDTSLGKIFENIEILAKDSMFVFIETTIDIETLTTLDTQFLYTDAIQFDTGNNQQKVELVTLVKDAHFIYPQRFQDEDTGETIIETLVFDVDGDGMDDETSLQGRFLTDPELTFTNEKPYVIYGYAGVDDGKTLTIEAGARVHFHANSGLIVTGGGSLKVNGALSSDQELLENEVIFEGDRLEPLYTDIPGQWGTIWLFNGSLENEIKYATIKNATVGVLSEGNANAITNKLSITNSQIYNSSNFGILGRATSISAENIVINNSGQSSFAGTIGGKYNVTHSTIANYWNNSFRQFPALLLNNYVIDADNNTIANADTTLTEANFTNCIIYGNDNPELLLDRESDVDFEFKFTNCLIRFEDTNDNFPESQYNLDNEDRYLSVFFNQEPDFLDTDTNKLNIGEDSFANGRALPLVPSGADLLGTTRDAVDPDIGAYESIVFEDN